RVRLENEKGMPAASLFHCACSAALVTTGGMPECCGMARKKRGCHGIPFFQPVTQACGREVSLSSVFFACS
ncbi:hypothetical protein ACLBYN_74090, partial [Pseudomonas aeruginosa]